MSNHVSSILRSVRRSGPALVATLVIAGAVVTPSQAATPPPPPSDQTGPGDQTESGDAETSGAPRAAFGVQPANAGGGIDDRAFFGYGLPALATVYDYVGIVNYGDETLTLDVYATDAVSSETGDFSLLPGGQAPSDAGAWVSVGDPTAQVSVPAAGDDGPGTVVLPVTIAVPENATPGDHTAGVLAVLTTLGENPDGQNVQLEQRVAARVYLRVDGDLSPGLQVSDVSGTYRAGRMPWQPGRVDLSYTVTNVGNVRMGVAPSATVTGPFGLNERRGTATPLPELLPRGSFVVDQTIDNVWPLVALGADIRLEPLAAPGAQAPDLGPTTAEATLWAIPWQGLVVLLLVVLVVVLIVWRSRRRIR